MKIEVGKKYVNTNGIIYTVEKIEDGDVHLTNKTYIELEWARKYWIPYDGLDESVKRAHEGEGMNQQIKIDSEFEKWLIKTFEFNVHNQAYYSDDVEKCWNHQQTKINELEKELNSLQDRLMCVQERDVAPLDIKNMELEKQLEEAVELLDFANKEMHDQGVGELFRVTNFLVKHKERVK